jgi:hypothetical protein
MFQSLSMLGSPFFQFAGETPIVINQGFYATMYLSNMATLVKMDNDITG